MMNNEQTTDYNTTNNKQHNKQKTANKHSKRQMTNNEHRTIDNKQQHNKGGWPCTVLHAQ